MSDQQQSNPEIEAMKKGFMSEIGLWLKEQSWFARLGNFGNYILKFLNGGKDPNEPPVDADANANTSTIEEETIYRLSSVSRTLSLDSSAEATTARANIESTISKLRDGSLNLADNFSVASTGGSFGNTHDLALGVQTAYDPADPLRSISVIAGFAAASVGLQPEEGATNTQVASAQTTAPPVEETPAAPVGATITLPKS